MLGKLAELPLGDGSDGSSIECAQTIYNITKAIQGGGGNIPPSLMGIVLNSGKGINDLGFYDACQNSTDTKYITFRPNTTMYEKKAFYGLCLPASCDVGTVNDLMTPYFTKQITPGLEKINNAEGQFTFTAVDPSPNAKDELQTTGILALTLISALGIVSCVGSCFNASVGKRDVEFQNQVRNSMGDRYEAMMNSDYDLNEGVPVQTGESFLIKFTKCFDFIDNLKRLFADNEKSYYQFTYLDGLKCIFLIYTIFANDYFARIALSQNITDTYSIESFKNGWTYMFCVGAQYGIDVFLFISGVSSFLMYSQRLKESRAKGLFGLVGFYIKGIICKWMSMAPLYFILAAIYYTIIPATVGGPVNSIFDDYTQQCADGGFWYSFLMFGNINVNYQCMNWCWYLAIEFQSFFFILASVILFNKAQIAGYASLFLWIAASIGATFGIWFTKDLTLPVGVIPRESVNDDYMLWFYAQSFTRWSAVMFGGLVGCALVSKTNHIPYEFNRNPVGMADLDKEEVYEAVQNGQPSASIPSFLNNNTNPQEKSVRKTPYDWKLAIPCTIASIILMGLPIFIYRIYQNDHTNGVKWSATQQSLFAMFGSWSVIAGVMVMGLPAFMGKKSVAMMFFGGSFWSPLSRMFLGMYMIHLMLIQYNIAQSFSFQY